jgi:hypothetical protein
MSYIIPFPFKFIIDLNWQLKNLDLKIYIQNIFYEYFYKIIIKIN